VLASSGVSWRGTAGSEPCASPTVVRRTRVSLKGSSRARGCMASGGGGVTQQGRVLRDRDAMARAGTDEAQAASTTPRLIQGSQSTREPAWCQADQQSQRDLTPLHLHSPGNLSREGMVHLRQDHAAPQVDRNDRWLCTPPMMQVPMVCDRPEGPFDLPSPCRPFPHVCQRQHPGIKDRAQRPSVLLLMPSLEHAHQSRGMDSRNQVPGTRSHPEAHHPGNTPARSRRSPASQHETSTRSLVR
jgi:hypothetical protein